MHAGEHLLVMFHAIHLFIRFLVGALRADINGTHSNINQPAIIFVAIQQNPIGRERYEFYSSFMDRIFDFIHQTGGQSADRPRCE